ncbi:MAG: hypothetical protein ACE5EQ_09720 [Phycisphaerae bacterium]
MTEHAAMESNTFDTRIRDILAIHFDPEHGTPFWLDRARELGFDPREAIRTTEDLPRLGLMQPEMLRARPIEDLLPQSLRDRSSEVILARTGGTLGRPVWTAYTDSEFHEAFVEPFIAAASYTGFPTGGVWLYVGPAGPHIIARAAEALARRTGSATPFCVDFDATWAKKLISGSFAETRYLQHIVEQAMDIIRMHPIDTLFSTPVVIKSLGEALNEEQRSRLRGVHYGGLAIDAKEMYRLQTERFPNAVHLSGYGNTLFGCCLELDVSPGRELRYFPHGLRTLFGVLSEGQPQTVSKPDYCTAGVSGRLVFTRLDPAIFLANMLERDRVRLINPPSDAPAAFRSIGVASPEPLDLRNGRPAVSL